MKGDRTCQVGSGKGTTEEGGVSRDTTGDGIFPGRTGREVCAVSVDVGGSVVPLLSRTNEPKKNKKVNFFKITSL